MKRLLLGAGIAVALVFAAPAAAQASQHKTDRPVKSACQVAKKCRPAPLPVPKGGWPCTATKSCGQKHHRPVCPPPVVSHPVPPVLHNPKPRHDPKPPARQRVPVAAPVPELPRTGSDVAPLLLSSFGLIGGGTWLRRKARAR